MSLYIPNAAASAALYDNFVASFNKACRSAGKRGKEILPYLSNFLRRWYYAALLEDSPLSPANLLDLANGPVMMAPVLCRQPGAAGLAAEDLAVLPISLTQHPAAVDLLILLDFCRLPQVIADDGFFPAGQPAELYDRLSRRDADYTEFLLQAAYQLGLLGKIPSLYTNKVQTLPDAAAFAQTPLRVVLDRLVDAAVALAVQALGKFVPDGSYLFTGQWFYDRLRSPLDTDDIFRQVYREFALDMDVIWDGQANPMRETLFSNTFLLGLLLDKFFYTRFGYYLRLIQPLYILPFEFGKEMGYVLEAIRDKDLNPALYAPCSLYHLTSLGQEYFQRQETGEGVLHLRPKLPLDELVHAVLARTGRQNRRMDDLADGLDIWQEEPHRLVVIKAQIQRAPEFWKNLELDLAMTLHDAFLEIAYHLHLDMEAFYSFFPDQNRSQFQEYLCPQSRRRTGKRADAIRLSELDLQAGKGFLLQLTNCEDPFLSLEEDAPARVRELPVALTVMSVKERNGGESFPRVVRRSKRFKELER